MDIKLAKSESRWLNFFLILLISIKNIMIIKIIDRIILLTLKIIEFEFAISKGQSAIF